MGIVDALQNGKVAYTGNSASKVKIELGDGNAQISVRGNGVDIKTGIGNQTVGVLGNDVSVKLDTNAPIDWDPTQDFDQVGVVSTKKTVNVNTGDGNDTAVVVADNANITMGKGEHLAVYYGNNATVNLGEAGQNIVMSADKAIVHNVMTSEANFAGIKVGEAAINAIEERTKEVVNTWEKYNEVDKTGFMKAMQTTYNLDDANMQMLEQLYDSGALSETFKDGNGKEYPRYSIMPSVTQKGANGETKYILCYNDWATNNGEGMHTRGLIELADGQKPQYGKAIEVGGKRYGFKECVATKLVQDVQEYKTQQTKTVYEERYYNLEGTKNVTINMADSNTSIVDLTAVGKVTINGGDASMKAGEGYSINVDAAVRTTESEIKSKVVATGKNDTIRWLINDTNTNTYTSPLVLDTNHDGVISAKSGNGVDVNNDGVADGYATGGDKMLAFTDTNANGKIDGTEVFGNNTVDPFTGKSINAANGFEALKVVAQSAEKATGIACYKDGKVDLNALKTALATKGIELGYISDANTTQVEALENYNVASIAVDQYTEDAKAAGDVQHRQQSTYTTADGETYTVDDVWFKERSRMDKMLDDLK